MYPIIPITDNLNLPSYFTVIALAYCVAIFFLYYRTLKKGAKLMVAMDLALIIMIAGFIGSRLFHVFYEAPSFYFENPMEAFKFWNGGFVFYGGAFSAVIGCFIYLRKKAESIGEWLDIFAPIVPLTYFIGRFGTLLSGSGYDKPTNLPWGIIYPAGTEAPPGISLHPTPLYAMAWEGLTLLILIWVEKRSMTQKKTGFLFTLMVGLHASGRLIVEQFRNDDRGFQLLSLTVSSWISMILILLVAYILKTRSEHQ